jgi:hypothetical protein
MVLPSRDLIMSGSELPTLDDSIPTKTSSTGCTAGGRTRTRITLLHLFPVSTDLEAKSRKSSVTVSARAPGFCFTLLLTCDRARIDVGSRSAGRDSGQDEGKKE